MLLVVRHGRTAANAGGLLLGRADPPLDELGRSQALAIAAALPDVARVVSSPLARARETAAALGAPVEVDERWIELDYGDWDQRPIDEVDAAEWARWRGDLAFAPPGGESLVSLGERVRAACDDLLEEAREHDVAVVTHVSPYKAAIAWALDVGDELAWRLHVAPAAISRVTIRPTGPVVLSLGEVHHLPPG
jgi:broad specificity phosphatase PhoE